MAGGTAQRRPIIRRAGAWRNDVKLPRTVPRVHDRVQAGLLAEMSGEKIPGKFVPSTLEMAQLSPVDHSRESGSSRAGLDSELAGEGDQESARIAAGPYRAGSMRSRSERRGRPRQRARVRKNDQYRAGSCRARRSRLRQVPGAACEGCSSGCLSRRDGPGGTRCPERERRASTRSPDGCRAW